MTTNVRVAEPGVTSNMRLRVQEDLPDPLVTPLTYFGDSLRLWFSGGEEFYEDVGKTDPCEDGDVVWVWGDKSGLGYDATKVSSPVYDEDACNNIGGLVCAGGDGGLGMSTDVIPAATDEVWYFGVWKMIGHGRYVATYNHDGVGKWAFQAWGNGSAVRMTVGTTGGQKEVDLTCDTTDFVCLSCRGKEGLEWRLWRNGVDKGAVNCGGTTWQWIAPETSYHRLFYQSLTATCMEHMVVVGDIGTAGREWAEAYVMGKYNLS